MTLIMLSLLSVAVRCASGVTVSLREWPIPASREYQLFDRLVFRRNVKQLARPPRVEAAHLVYCQAKCGRLDGEVGRGLSDIVESVPVRAAIREVALSDRDHQDGRVLRPSSIALNEHAQQPLERFGIVTPGDDKPPGLLVVARGRRARCFERGAQLFRLDGSGRKCVGTAPPLEEVLYGLVVTGGKFLALDNLHRLSPLVSQYHDTCYNDLLDARRRREFQQAVAAAM